MLDGLTVVYRSSVDLYFYVMGSQYENEVSVNAKFDILIFYFIFRHTTFLCGVTFQQQFRYNKNNSRPCSGIYLKIDKIQNKSHRH